MGSEKFEKNRFIRECSNLLTLAEIAGQRQLSRSIFRHVSPYSSEAHLHRIRHHIQLPATEESDVSNNGPGSPYDTVAVIAADNTAAYLQNDKISLPHTPVDKTIPDLVTMVRKELARKSAGIVRFDSLSERYCVAALDERIREEAKTLVLAFLQQAGCVHIYSGAHDYEVVDERLSYRQAGRPSPYVIIKNVRKVGKRISDTNWY